MGTKRLVTDTMRSRIINGRYQHGERLPSGKELCQEFDVSASTAVYAMRALAEEGYVETRQGAGNFVKQTRVSGEEERPSEQRAVVYALRIEAERLMALASRLERVIR